MNSGNQKSGTYFLWMIAGGAAFWAELFLLSLSSHYELFKETVVLSVVPTVIFCFGASMAGKQRGL